ncbi:MAG TPA: S-adenosyl-methyltransferase [Bacteroidales bacterium]|nr:S-adenosyl-methyltransferase [Bacteroidales bacterium]HCB63361.1 S-adenosyl-methyltransferase [Bacteroidales bacterium]HCY23064.1 S-adenosyl-methyltransferase [Bacteroidales bacterium]
MKEKKNISNEMREKEEPKSGAQKEQRKGRFSAGSILTGSFLEKEGLIRQLPFILFVFFLFMLYIANAYYGEKTVFRIEQYKSEMIELRSEYISSKTRLMTGTNISKLSDKLKPENIFPSHTPPGKIFVQKTEDE